MVNNYNFSQFNYSGARGLGGGSVPGNNKKKIALVIAGIVMAIAVIVLGVVFMIPRSDESDDEEIVLVYERPNSPLLQAYASLSNEMPISQLEQAVKSIAQDVELTVDEEEGIGYLRNPEGKEYIAFYYDTIDYSGDDESDEPIGSPTTVTYTGDTIAYDIRYVREPEEENDDFNLSISYSEEDGLYYVYDLEEVYEFKTRQEAIDAYLSPTASQQTL